MKIFGYSHESQDQEEGVSIELAEIVMEATTDEVRMIAAFLNKVADDMQSMGEDYDHEHLSDVNHYFKNSPHFVIVRSK